MKGDLTNKDEMAANCSMHKGAINAYRILDGESERKNSLERPERSQRLT
jgi:hypothetical protein